MGLRAPLAHLADGAPVPVFPVVGQGGRDQVRRLGLSEALTLVATPRAASVLLVAGPLPPALERPARVVHAQLAPPRRTLCWGGGTRTFPGAVEVAASEDPVPALRELANRAACLDTGETPVRPGGDAPERPMADVAPDRDGLALDRLPVRFGPLLPVLPPGLALDVLLQGDVVQEAAVGPNPFTAEANGERGDDPFERALAGPVPIAEVELARARHHLLWLGDALRVQGLAALGRRSLRLACQLTSGSRPALARLRRLVSASQVMRWSLPTDPLSERLGAEPGLGPVSRATGRPNDARSDDHAYRAMGFEPVVGDGRQGVASLWRQRLTEADQALALAGQAGSAHTALTDVVEGPRGPLGPGGPSPSARLLDLLPGLLAGQEWGDAVATVVGLDLDLEEAAQYPLAGRPAPQGIRA